MEVEVSIDGERRIAVVRITGTLDVGELARQAASFVERPDFVPGMPAIFDLRGLDFASFGAPESRAVAHVNRKLAPRRGAARVAAVVDGDLAFGILRMHEVLGQSPNLLVRAFRDLEEARRWVMTPFGPEEEE
jgi:hypothetical protein